MKVEYTDELEKLVMLHAECIISLIKANLNGPLHSCYRVSSKALDKVGDGLKILPFFLHSTCSFKKLFISGL